MLLSTAYYQSLRFRRNPLIKLRWKKCRSPASKTSERIYRGRKNIFSQIFHSPEVKRYQSETIQTDRQLTYTIV
jgi:hypothetical protein